jgi:hypothetical protein
LHDKDKLLRFGIDSFSLSHKQALKHYEECLAGMKALLHKANQRLSTECHPDKIKILVHVKDLAEKALR